MSLCSLSVPSPLGLLGLCPACLFSYPSMVGKCSQTKIGKFNVLVFFISSPGGDILRRLALGFYSDRTSLTSISRRRCGGSRLGHKFMSRQTKAPPCMCSNSDLIPLCLFIVVFCLFMVILGLLVVTVHLLAVILRIFVVDLNLFRVISSLFMVVLCLWLFCVFL